MALETANLLLVGTVLAHRPVFVMVEVLVVDLFCCWTTSQYSEDSIWAWVQQLEVGEVALSICLCYPLHLQCLELFLPLVSAGYSHE